MRSKYREDETIKIVQDYIARTYQAHYSSQEKGIQTLDLLEGIDIAEQFCQANIIKYASRYAKKGQHKKDVLKIIHYAILLYYFTGTSFPDDEVENLPSQELNY